MTVMITHIVRTRMATSIVHVTLAIVEMEKIVKVII